MTLHDGCTWSLFCGLVQTSSGKFGQVRTGVKGYFSSTLSRTLSKFGPAPKPSCSFLMVPRSKHGDPPRWWKQRFVTLQLAWGVNWYKVPHFWEHFQKRYIIRKLLLSRVQTWNFTRIGPKTKKLWLSIIPALRRSYQPRLGQPQKGVNYHFFLAALGQAIRVVGKLLILEA